jgi:hypothetical protein
MNGHGCFALWDDYLVIRIANEGASKLAENDPHARLFDLIGTTMRAQVMVATDALGEEDLQNYIDMAICSPSYCRQKPANRQRKERGPTLVNSA